MYANVRQFAKRWHYRLSGRKIRLFRGATVWNCRFEGYNAVRQNACVSDSRVGEGTYIGSGSEISGTRIGRWCSVADNVKIGLGSHPTHFVSTSGLLTNDTMRPFGFAIHRGVARYDNYKKADGQYIAIIGNDVWIGSGVKVMNGVTVGDGAIIGTGAVVTKNVEPYTIVAGVPARPIRKRFTEEQIVFLLAFRWWERGVDWVKANYRDMENIEAFMQKHAG